jgi:hypothetical protein
MANNRASSFMNHLFQKIERPRGNLAEGPIRLPDELSAAPK